jgi:hypothetical protein
VWAPRLRAVGHSISLANGGTYDLPGRARNDEVYRKAGVEFGRQRYKLTITLKPSLSGKIWVTSKRTGNLLALIAAGGAGGGYAVQTDDDVTIKNDTGDAIQSSGSSPDFAVMEEFYVDQMPNA